MPKDAVNYAKLLEYFLLKEQKTDGWARSYAFSEDGNFKESIGTIYFSLLLGSIISDDYFFITPEFKTKYLKKLYSALVKERSKQNTYNYWIRGGKDYLKRNIPDDWDDTALAYSIFFQAPELQTARAYPLLRQAWTKTSSFFSNLDFG